MRRATPAGADSATSAIIDSLRRRCRPALLLAALALHGGAARAEPDTDVDSPAGPYAVVAAGVADWDYDCGLFNGCSSAATATFKLGAGWRWRMFSLEAWALDYGSTTTRSGTRLHPRAIGVGGAWQWPAGPQVDVVLRAGIVEVSRTRSYDSNGTGHAAFGLALVGRMTSTLKYEVAWDNTQAVLERFANTLTVGVRAEF